MKSCCYEKDGVQCDESRYNSQNKPRQQMLYISCFDVLKAMYANVETSTLLRHRDKLLQQTLCLLNKGKDVINTYSDFGDGAVQQYLYEEHELLRGKSDVAFALSTDGAQLTMKKQSNTWIALLIILNLPPEVRYKTNNTIVPFIIPGPNSPGFLESFMHPLFVDMAKASEGIWMWDAVDSSYFVQRSFICTILGDMLGSAKMSGMAGHTAVHGDRFSMVSAARSSTKSGSKYVYYPISPPQNETYNPGRQIYDLESLPLRNEKDYWETITNLHNTNSKTRKAAIVKQTGVGRMPLAAASPAFVHPSFFPLDPFHLFFENIVPFIWDIWTTISSPTEPVHISKEKAAKFGKLVVEGMKTLPPSFCGPVRDPHLKRQSQYKAYEWMALLYWYILPIGIELEFDPWVLQNFSELLHIIEFAMTVKPRSDNELDELQKKINHFLLDYEKLYVGANPERISRCRLCIFQLVHVPMHIKWYGSIRLGSQATVERAIGEAGHKIHSQKSPFANMANIFFEKEVIKALLLYYPDLIPKQEKNQKPMFFKRLNVLKRERKPGQAFYVQMQTIFQSYMELGEFDCNFPIKRWGKCNLSNGRVLSSVLSETSGGQCRRSSCHFEAQSQMHGQPIFGKALGFFEIEESKHCLVAFHKLVNKQKTLGIWRGKWSNTIEILEVAAIVDVIGVWAYGSRVYPLRKYPGLNWLSSEERFIEDGDDWEEEDK
jgi:hypothetical protein